VAAIGERLAKSGAAAVLTTAKDAVRFESLGEMPFALYRVPLQVEFDPAEALFGSISAVLR
jgi:tetraacyldisaccharide-1-P 4'-kinase